MRFLADMGVAMAIVEWLRARGHDATHLREQGLQRVADADVFEKARAEARILLTFDLDFGEIVALTRGAATSIILFRVRDTRTPRVIQRLERVLQSSSEDLQKGAVIVVEDGRHRVRRLPVGS
jgi:predicted nuclease of predicted toxin-antitoxin system